MRFLPRSYVVIVLGAAVASMAASICFTLTWHKYRQPRRIVVQKAVQPAPPAAVYPPTLLLAGTDAVPIIMYHDVVPKKQVWFDMTTHEFALQMQQLDAAGAHPVSLDDLYAHLQSGAPLPAHPIVLTFDDATLGQYTDALPILEKHGFKAVFFVQTASVGRPTEKQHVTWNQLREAEATGLVTVESHTVTHPEDITKVPDAQLSDEMQRSKAEIEHQLDHAVRFLAYPSGNCDIRVERAAAQAGYVAAVTMDRGWAASPAQSYFLPRLTPQRLPEVLTAWKGLSPIAPPLPREVVCAPAPLQRGVFAGDGLKIQWVAGGHLGTKLLSMRQTVGEMAWQASAPAALNGGFFADAEVSGTTCTMIGPALTRDGLYQSSRPEHDARLEGRPLVMLSDDRCLVLPYAKHLGGSREVLASLMPDVKDAFVAGAWIVHDGHALPPGELEQWAVSDAEDARHRSFAGVDREGHFLIGACDESVATSDLAPVLQGMGMKEAWLMDSGFSTSLIWENRVIASGHASKDLPSRPVPHALLLFGAPATTAAPPPADAPLAGGPGAVTAVEAMDADDARTVWKIRPRRSHHRYRSWQYARR